MKSRSKEPSAYDAAYDLALDFARGEGVRIPVGEWRIYNLLDEHQQAAIRARLSYHFLDRYRAMVAYAMPDATHPCEEENR